MDKIKPRSNATDGILALKSLTLRYKEEIDPERKGQFGFVAEEVEKVNPDLVAHGNTDKPTPFAITK